MLRTGLLLLACLHSVYCLSNEQLNALSKDTNNLQRTLPPITAPLPKTIFPLLNRPSSVVNAGWLQFPFGTAGTISPFVFSFNLTESTLLRVVDGYCSGDTFNIYDNGVAIGSTPNAAINCTNVYYEPDTTFQDNNYSRTSIALDPGNHYITFVVRDSPFFSGSAFARVDTLMSQCSYGQFTVIQDPKRGECSAGAYMCADYGLTYARVDQTNVEEAAATLAACTGMNSQAWVSPSPVANYVNGNACLVVAVGESPFIFDVNVPNDPSLLKLPVLCSQLLG